MKRVQLRYILLAVTALGLLVWGAAVTIPNSFADGDVISAGEMNANFTAVKGAVDTNENNIASLQANQVGAAQSVDAGVTTLTTTIAAASSVDVTAPGPGFVLVMSSAEIVLTHTSGGGSSNVNYGVSEVATGYDNDQDKDVQVPSAAATGTYYLTTSAQKVFPVASAGTYTFYTVANNGTASTSASLSDVTLSALFIPGSAGAVSQTSIAPAASE